MYIPDEILKCVVFIGYEQAQENGRASCAFGGTGFLVSIPVENDPTERQHIYLVTAQHNIATIRQKGLERLRVSVNTTEGGRELISLQDEWFEHPNHGENPADITVIPFPLMEKYDVRTIPINMLLREEYLKDGRIGIGNEVFITGLFNRHHGQKSNLPIIRMGNIAMLSQEKIKTRAYGEIDAYLIEARSIGGISGSPVFFQQPSQKGGMTFVSQQPLWLGGLIHGHYPTSEEVVDSLFTEEDGGEGKEKSINMGIAIVTPAIKILETLNRPELQEQRRKTEAGQ